MTRSHILDWYWNVRIVLKQERRLYVLQNLILFILDDDTNDEVINKYQYQINNNEQTIICVMWC